MARNARKVTANEAREALEILFAFGTQSFHDDANVTDGTALGNAVNKLTANPRVMLDGAAEAYEDHNHHGTALLLRTILNKPQNVSTNPEAKTFTIHVPEMG